MNLVAALLLAPLLHHDGELRLVSDGTGNETVEWYLDGMAVAETRDGQPAVVNATAGAHELWAQSEYEGAWNILARLEPWTTDGAVYVPAWTASHEATRAAAEPSHWWLPLGVAAVGAAVVLWPKHP